MYFVFLAPAMILALWAQAKVSSAYAKMSRVPVSSGLTGAQAAQRVLRDAGCFDVGIEMTQGMLSDHYDPRHKVLRLSPQVYSGRSIASVGVACHEAGHALQHAANYGPMAIRNAIVPVASIGSGLSWILIIAGMFMAVTGLIWAGIALFSSVVVFQLVNLPVEFDASKRARVELLRTGIVSHAEDAQVGKVLNAAAMTYVAATLTAVLQLLYFVSLASGRRD
ncbi:MAG: zinc metallopeptidase [Phycisphaerales bacterium]|nr:zinc metallopeptidase [Phycisphaerales bacterium]